MSTEVFLPALTGHVADRQVSVTAQKNDTSRLVDAIAETLVDGGWTLVEGVYPESYFYVTAIFVADSAHPIPEEDREPAACGGWVWYGCDPGTGAPIAGFDPFRELPPVGCCSFPYGLSQEDSADSLAGAVSECTPFGAAYDAELSEEFHGVRAYKLTATVPGTPLNGYCFSGDLRGTYSFAIPAWNGGWKLRSQTYRGHYLELTITATGRGDNGNQVLLSLITSAGEGTATTRLTTSPPYTYKIVADAVQFAVWASSVDGDVGGSGQSAACLASMPQVDDAKVSGLAHCAVFITALDRFGTPGSNLRTQLTYAPGWCALNGGFFMADQNIGIAALRLPEHDILLPDKKAIIENPYIWAAPSGETPYLLGKLWDSVVLSSSQLNRDSVMVWDQTRYVCMGKQLGSFGQTSASLWLTVN